MVRPRSLCLIAAAAAAAAEDLTALVQLDVHMHLGADRAAAPAARSSGAANASVAPAEASGPPTGSTPLAVPNATDVLALAGLNASTAGAEASWLPDMPPAALNFSDAFALAAMNVSVSSMQAWSVDEEMKSWVNRYEEDLHFSSEFFALKPTFLKTCIQRGYGNEAECQEANEVLRDLYTDINYWKIPPKWSMWAVRTRLALTWFLWAPGPPMSFLMADKDHNDLVTWQELQTHFTWQVMSRVGTLRRFLDKDHDGNTTRAELFGFLRSGILIRDQLSKVDGYNPKASTATALKHAHKLFYYAHLESHLPRTVKVICLIALAIATAVFIVWAECGLRRSGK